MVLFSYPEGATPIDPDEADGLIPDHITTRRELDRWEQENILDAIQWIERAKPNQVTSIEFFKLLHERMFSKVWKWAGHFRTSDKNIGVPWYNISVEVRNLCNDADYQIQCNIISPDEIAMHLHHRLVSIHPFPNGNGRHARMITDILLENVLNVPKFTWGDAELNKDCEVRRIYIDALWKADAGDFKELRRFVRS